MVKTMSNNVSSSSADETKKQHKKQAKREAKAMLAVEQAKQDVQKAEQKVAKFQARLEARVAHLHTLEAKLTRIRTSPQEPEIGTSGGGVDGHQEQTEPAQAAVDANATDEPESTSPVNTTSPTDQEVSLPPVEGRPDIPQDQETTSSSEQMREEALDTEDNFQGRSDTENENTPAHDSTDSSPYSEETQTQSEEAISQDIDLGDTDY